MVSGQKFLGHYQWAWNWFWNCHYPEKLRRCHGKSIPNPQAARSGPQLYAAAPLLDPYRNKGTPQLLVKLLYGSGLPILAAARLRLKDLDFQTRHHSAAARRP